MGNGAGKVCLCSSGAGEISGRYDNFAAVPTANQPLGNSICYTRPDPSPFSSSSNISDDAAAAATAAHMTFRSISGASVSANSATPPSVSLADSSQQYGCSVLDSTASFESSPSFTSTPLHLPPAPAPPPRGSSVGFDPRLNWSSVDEKEAQDESFDDESTKLKRSFSDNENNGLSVKSNNSLKKIFRRAISSVTPISKTTKKKKNNDEDDENEDGSLKKSSNLQWAQGRAGEDRTHIVISEDHGWVFVGIYDGFNGPDATDYLLNNLFNSVHNELKEILQSRNEGTDCWSHSSVLEALSEGLRKTEEEFLRDSDDIIMKNPVLAMMGSCVLVMLMRGDDVYLMNVGDSRTVLAHQTSEYDDLNSVQLTVDHSTNVKEEIQRIKMEHPDDPSAISRGRVKGHLNVTRAFGVGFLKQPKQNNVVLETFRVKYIGESPYITCCPSLHHHRLTPSDRFLILSSDGLYQYFTNQEAVSMVHTFITFFPERDPAQLLIEEALSRAAKKAGMEFHELLDIPQGERRLFHDDISIVIISLEGKIWRSSV